LVGENVWVRARFSSWLVPCVWLTIAVSLVGAVAVAGVDDGPVAVILVWAVPVVGCALVGGLLVVRVGRNPVGWVFVTIGVALGLGILCDSVVVASAGGSRVVTAATAGEVLLEPLPVFVLPVLLLFFPDGRLASARWRPIAWVAAMAATVVAAAALVGSGSSSSLLGADAPSPLAQNGALGSVLAGVGAVAWLALSAVLVVSAGGLVVRFRSARGVVRQQLKWFGLGASGLAAAGVIDYVLSTSAGDAVWAMAATAMAASTGVAILRYRLYDIDVIIRKTLVYATLVVCMAMMYVGGIALLSWVFRKGTGQTGAPEVTLSTLAVAAVFHPLRTRIQTAVDHRFYRQKYDASKTLRALTAHISQQTDLDAVTDQVLAIVQHSLQPTHANLWLNPHDQRSD
jgi:hypothetical protein